MLYKRHTDAAAICICESHQNRTSFPTLGILPACTRHTFRGSQPSCVIPRASRESAPRSRTEGARRHRGSGSSLEYMRHLVFTFPSPTKDRVSSTTLFPTFLCSILSACPALRTGCLSTRTLGIALTQQTQQCRPHSRKRLRSSSLATVIVSLGTRTASSHQLEPSRLLASLPMAEPSPRRPHHALLVSLPTGPAVT